MRKPPIRIGGFDVANELCLWILKSKVASDAQHLVAVRAGIDVVLLHDSLRYYVYLREFFPTVRALWDAIGFYDFD